MPSPITAAITPMTITCIASPSVRAARASSLLALGELRLHLLAPALLLREVVGHPLELGLQLLQLPGQLLLVGRRLLGLGQAGLQLVQLPLRRLELIPPEQVADQQSHQDRDDRDDGHPLAVHRVSLTGRGGPSLGCPPRPARRGATRGTPLEPLSSRRRGRARGPLAGRSSRRPGRPARPA